MLKKIFLDKRGTVTGKDSHINLHNFIDLNAHIVNVVTTNMSLPFTYSNGLTLTGSNVMFGGDLTANTIIDGGNTYNLSFIDLDGFNVSAQAVDITASTNLFINTPNTSSADNGWVLTLIDDATGETEWQILPINNADNGLHIDNNILYLGGTLLENTIVDGDAGTYSLFILGTDQVGIESVNDITIATTDPTSNVVVSGAIGVTIETTEAVSQININSTTVTTNAVDIELIGEGTVIRGSSLVGIQTPDQIALTATNGQVLTLIDSATGECEWQDPLATAVNNGLNIDGSTIQLGGTLVESTTINGDAFTYDVYFTDVATFNVNAANGSGITDTSYVYLQSNSCYLEVSNNGTKVQSSAFATEIRTIDNLIFSPIGTADYTILVDPTTAGGALNLQLPSVGDVLTGTTYIFKLISVGTMTLTPTGAEVIFDNADQASISTAIVGTTIRIQSNGIKWYVI